MIDTNLTEGFLKATVHFFDSPEKMSTFLEWFNLGREVLAVDVETNGKDHFYGGKVRLFQVGDLRAGWSIPFEGNEAFCRWIMNESQRRGWIIVGHNFMFDLVALYEGLGWQPTRWDLVHDTYAMSKCIGVYGFNGLKPLSEMMVHPKAGVFQRNLDAVFTEHKVWWDTVPLNCPQYWKYGAMDVVIQSYLFNILRHELESGAHRSCLPAYYIERAALEPIHAATIHGVQIDIPYCREQINDLNVAIRELEHQAKGLYGSNLSLSKNDGLITFLQREGIVFVKKTSGGKFCLDKEILEEFAGQHPLFDMISNHRELNRFISAYYGKFERLADADSVVHMSIKQFDASTMRMAVSNPPLQQIPTRTPRGKKVRGAIVPREGNRLVACDLSSIEFRLFVHHSEEPALQEAMRQGLDGLQAVASQVFGVPYEQVTKQQRTHTKNVAYACIYGAGPAKMGRTLGVPQDEAEKIYHLLHERFPAIKRYSKRTEAEGVALGEHFGVAPMIQTQFGNRLPVRQLDAVYALGNYRLQGEAAVIFKAAMVRACAAGLKDYLTLYVHDECVLDVPVDMAEEAGYTLRECMQDMDTLCVPILAECSEPVERWNEAK